MAKRNTSRKTSASGEVSEPRTDKTPNAFGRLYQKVAAAIKQCDHRTGMALYKLKKKLMDVAEHTIMAVLRVLSKLKHIELCLERRWVRPVNLPAAVPFTATQLAEETAAA